MTVSLRTIPIRYRGERIGAIVLCRDVTEVRHQERELITKDATIREIHHRVKNNLQTVASLLRIQARRTHSDVARDALGQAMRRVAAIAVVHDTLSEGLNQNVDFDVVFDRVLMLIAEVSAGHNTTVHPKSSGSFGILPSRVRDPARARADRAGDERGRARARRPGGRRGRDRRQAHRRHAQRQGARQRHRAARGRGRLRPGHPDRAHAHPGRARRHHRLAHPDGQRHRGDDRRAADLPHARRHPHAADRGRACDRWSRS